MGADLDRRRIGPRGTSERAWSRCPQLRELPRMSAQDLIGDAMRMVVLAPHPDDEILAVGGLVSLAARVGLEVHVVAVTDGEASHPVAWADQTARRRQWESEQAINELGLDPSIIERWHLPDGELIRHEPELTARMTELLDAADLVVTTWILDGHPDHEACARAAIEAARQTGARVLQAPVWGWHWARPESGALPWDRAIRVELPEEIRRAKCRSIEHFESQIQPRHGSNPVLTASTLERFQRSYEVFFQ